MTRVRSENHQSEKEKISIDTAGEKIHEYYNVATDSLKQLEDSIRAGVEKQPLLVLGGAFAGGYLLGILAKRFTRSSNSENYNSELSKN